MVRARRLALRKTQRQLAVAAGVSDQTWVNIEKGERVSDRSLYAIDEALGWTSGSAWRVLEGGRATERKPTDSTSVLPAAWEERFRTLEREVARLKDELDQEKADRLAEKEDRDRQLAEAAASREQRAEANQRRRQQRENETT